MKILHAVESYLPARNGMSEVVRQLSEHMVRLGHEVVVATSSHPERTTDRINGVSIQSFTLAGNMVQGISGEDRDQYLELAQDTSFDIVTCFAAQQWATDLLLPILSNIKAKKVFVPTGFSALPKTAYQDYFSLMPQWMNDFDINIMLSSIYQDTVFAKKHGINNLAIIPNGASEEEFESALKSDIRKKLKISPNKNLILHVGSYTGLKGHWEAAKIFLEAGLSNTVLLFVGQNVDDIQKSLGNRIRYFEIPKARILSNCKILIRNLDRADLVDIFKTADLFLFPSAVECSPIVLFEAAAAGLPFLSTDVGNAQEIAEWTGGGKIIPTTFKNYRGIPDMNAGSAILKELMTDATLRKHMGERARTVWKAYFTWEKITDRYLSVYQQLLENQTSKL